MGRWGPLVLVDGLSSDGFKIKTLAVAHLKILPLFKCNMGQEVFEAAGIEEKQFLSTIMNYNCSRRCCILYHATIFLICST